MVTLCPDCARKRVVLIVEAVGDEQEAIDLYKELGAGLRQAGDYKNARQVLRIQKDEERHKRFFDKLAVAVKE